jgi:hypothetical protein
MSDNNSQQNQINIELDEKLQKEFIQPCNNKSVYTGLYWEFCYLNTNCS